MFLHAREVPGAAPRRLSLQECLSIALENNRSRPASRLGVEIAEGAAFPGVLLLLAGAWTRNPPLTRMDEDPNFIFPGSSVTTPGFTIPLPGAPVAVPGQTIDVPEQKIKLMDRDSWTTTVDLMYPSYTGGLRPSLVKQAKSGVEAARQEARRTDLQVVYDVKRFYYGAVLAKRLRGDRIRFARPDAGDAGPYGEAL